MLAVFGAIWPKRVATPAPTPTVRPAGLWVDLSNLNGPLTDAMCDDMLAAKVVGVVIQAITGLDGVSQTRQQLQKAHDRGFRIAGYVWCFHGFDVSSRLHMFDGFTLEWLAVDVEDDNVTTADVDRDLALCDAYQGGSSEVYIAVWVFARHQWTTTQWAARRLWVASYDGNPNPDAGFVPFGGWTSAYTKQFTDGAVYGGVKCDLSYRRG